MRFAAERTKSAKISLGARQIRLLVPDQRGDDFEMAVELRFINSMYPHRQPVCSMVRRFSLKAALRGIIQWL